MIKIRRIIKALLILFLLLTLGVYAALHSPYVLKNFVLPGLGQQIGSPISVSDISFSPFSSLKTKDLKIGSHDNPSIKASEASLNYNLWEILWNKQINLSKIHLENTRLSLFQDKNGNINFFANSPKEAKPNIINIDGEIDLSLSNEGEHITASGEILIKELNAPDLLEMTSDLKSTKAKFNVVYNSNKKVDIKKLELNLDDDSGSYAQLSGIGNIKLPLGKEKSTLSLSSELIDVDRLIELFNTPTSKNTESSPNDTEHCEGINLDSLWLDLELKVDELKLTPLKVTSLDGKILSQKGKVVIEKLDWKQEQIPAHFKGDINLSTPDCNFNYSFELEPSPLDHLLSVLDQDDSGVEKGQLEKASFTGSGKGFSKNQLKNNFTGELSLKVRDAVLPSKFQNIPPFNIIFLPFKIVMDLGGTITSTILPEDLVELGSNARDILDESGQLDLNSAEFKLNASKGKVTVEKGEINTDLLPTVGFDGQVDYDGSLDLTTTLHILAVHLRIPIGGSLETPLPDLIELGPQLVKGLGLSLLNPLSNLIDEEDSEEVENLEEQPKEE